MVFGFWFWVWGRLLGWFIFKTSHGCTFTCISYVCAMSSKLQFRLIRESFLARDKKESGEEGVESSRRKKSREFCDARQQVAMMRQCDNDDDAPPQTKYSSVFGLLLLTYLVFLLIYLVDDQTRPDSIQLYFLKNISSFLHSALPPSLNVKRSALCTIIKSNTYLGH